MTAARGTLVCSADHVLHAFDSLLSHLTAGEQKLHAPSFQDVECPLFVTWNKAGLHGGEPRLRGCIGTFDPRPLQQGIRDYALTSALHDRRFAPVSLSELPLLSCTVSLLHSFERGSAWDDWEIGVHGITIEFADPLTSSRRSATFLPEVPAHESWDKEETLHHLVRKAGYHVGATSALRRSIKLTRYRSTTYTLTYDEYRKIKEPRMFRSSKVEKAHAEEAVTVPAG